MWGIGVKMGKMDHLKMGAVKAIYYFLHQYFLVAVHANIRACDLRQRLQAVTT